MNQPHEERDPLMSIEHELYDPRSKRTSTEVHTTREEKTRNLPTSWGDAAPILVKNEGDNRTSFGTKLFFAATLFLLVALAFTAYTVISSQNVVSAENIDMESTISPFVEGGEETPFTVTIRNRNKLPLLSAQATLLYTEGSGTQNEQEKVSLKKDLGTLGANEAKSEPLSLTLFGDERETRDVIIKLEYKVAGSNATFTKLLSSSVVIRSSPMFVSMSGKESVALGQTVTYTFVVKNNGATTSLPSVFQITPPSSFTVESATPNPFPKTLAFSIEPLPKGGEKVVEVSGSFSGDTNNVASFQTKIGSVGATPSSIGVVFSSSNKDITLKASPLFLSTSLDGGRGGLDSLSFGDKGRVSVSYENKSKEVLEDVSITVYLSGDAPLYQDIVPEGGYYDSASRSIVWDRASVPGLATLPPNAKGLVSFFVPVVLGGSNSPVLKVVIVGKGAQRGSEDAQSTLSRSWAVEGVALLSATTQYKTSPFPNSGPIPPRPNESTTYTAHLSVTAQNALKNVRVSFVLPVYVSWRDVSFGGGSSSYNSKTRTVTWDIGTLSAATVATTDIGLAVRPSQSHVGQMPEITSGIVLEGEEAVSRVRIKTVLSALTTRLINEPWEVNPSIVAGK